MFEAGARGAVERQVRVVERFLDEHLTSAIRFGWSNMELFGCHPNPPFATVRYDCMGAVTIAALTKFPIAKVAERAIQVENGLASRRPLPCSLAEPVWIVF